MQDTKLLRSMMLLDTGGHTTLAWDPESSDYMLPWINRMMSEGFTFWVVRRNPLREEQLQSLSDIGDGRHVIMRDPDARRLLTGGTMRLAQDSAEGEERDGTIDALRRARDAREVADNDTVAHRAQRGG